jgi:hypothetical protein
LENDNPTRTLQLIDDFVRDVLVSENLKHLKEIATGLIYSPHRALGILVARGVIPLLPSSQVIMIGRLAAGEPAAFVGALRLKATPNVMRQRIGINYRLLFRLWPGRLEVIDLINRKDLDRRIKTLT